MHFYLRCAGAGLLLGLSVMVFEIARVIYVIQINHRWRDLRQL